jgi:membrane-associated phospholipid phosphatase
MFAKYDSELVTDFGDQAVVLPLVVGIALLFVLSDWRRGALAWTAVMGGTLGLILVLKLAFLACGHLVSEVHLNSPSGHTGAAAAVYGGLSGIMMRSIWDTKHRILLCTAAVAIVFAAVVGETRLTMGFHSMAEVLAGGTIGVIGAIASVALAGSPAPGVRMSRIAGTGLAMLVLLHGIRLPAEAAIRSLAAIAIWQFSAC